MSKPNDRVEARRLRHQGRSLKWIAKHLGVSSSSVHRWCLGITLSEPQAAALFHSSQQSQMRSLGAINRKKKSLAAERHTKETIEGGLVVGHLTERDRLILGLGLYWGEGSKRGGSVELGNMDPHLLAFYISWLDSLGVPRDCIRATLSIAPGFDHEQEITWWCARLGLRSDQFTKVVIKRPISAKGKTKRPGYHGVLAIRVHRRLLMSRIKGMLDKVASLGGIEPPSRR